MDQPKPYSIKVFNREP